MLIGVSDNRELVGSGIMIGINGNYDNAACINEYWKERVNKREVLVKKGVSSL